MNIFALVFLIVIILIDMYVFHGIRKIYPNKNKTWYAYIAISIFTYIVLTTYYFSGKESLYFSSRIFLFGIAQSFIFAKLAILPFVLITDLYKAGTWLIRRLQNGVNRSESVNQRSGFIMRIGVIFGAFFFGTFIYGMGYGAYQIDKKRITVEIKDLPEELDGLKIVQISDFHLGSFASLTPVIRAIDAINEENADLFFFTGDLVNDKASETEPYIDIIEGIKTRYGKYSILGNHDYGEYVTWISESAKEKNLLELLENQKKMGWKVLLNESENITINNKKVSVIGVEYWGKSKRWGQHGDLDKALENTDSTDLKILLTHDPSHWDLVVSQNKKYRDIPLSLSGHTHGFQFGIEIPGLKWSPSQMVYPRWAGLYEENGQYLYVNRGLGFVGYPGRVGIAPEITIITFRKQAELITRKK